MMMKINRTPDSDTVLDELSKEKVDELIPVFVVVSFLLIFGLIGNGSVLFFFWRRVNENVTNFFILVLAIIDTLVCLTISLIIMSMSLTYKYKSDAGCKIQVFSKFVTALFSVLLLVTIAIHRYRRICCPFKRQLTLYGARIAVIIDMFIAVLLSLPMAFFYETTKMEVPNNYNVTVIGFGCISTRDEELKPFLTATNYTFAFLFILLSAVLIILYSFQGAVIYRYNKIHSSLKTGHYVNGTNSTSLSQELGNDKIVDSNPNIAMPMPAIKTSIDSAITNSINEMRPSASTDNINSQPNIEHSKTEGTRDLVSSIKITIMFCIITIGFIVCFTPYLIYAIRQQFTSNSSTSVAPTVEGNFLTHSYLVNSVINPIIYGFVHTEFRLFLKRYIFCCRGNKYFI